MHNTKGTKLKNNYKKTKKDSNQFVHNLKKTPIKTQISNKIREFQWTKEFLNKYK